MPLDSRRRRELMAAGHALRPEITVKAGAISAAAVEHVRAYLDARELGKIRVQTDSKQECRQVGEELSRRVPCEVVTCIGHVLLVCRTEPQPG